MTDLLEQVKSGLGVSGNYQDNTLQVYINEVKEYLLSAGVSREIIDSDKSVGVITRGVADLWNYGNGDTKFSEYFYQRAKQLTYAEIEQDEEVDILSIAEIDSEFDKLIK